ncbi:Small heat shock protein C4 [Zancudomyces culisetae]|uniref:Small heat shock protein C4 n=1 Tax=Zancudomyces culisetae TaxID=1213189 RepID=A0A1R1PKQ9_ZANCU|nr:Small heat shock protein C4 [Zancudomyces culisetae]|eukprot:OMH81561.1 Small heat shock protein C4 [Zancudomyces culisetae]
MSSASERKEISKPEDRGTSTVGFWGPRGFEDFFDPFHRHLAPFYRDLEDVFGGALARPLYAPFSARSGRNEGMDRLWNPRVDVRETKDKIKVIADIPGVPKENVEMKIVNDRIYIKGKKEESKLTEGEGTRIQERSWGNFERSFTLPKNVDTSKITAKMENGVLEVDIPVVEQAPKNEFRISID